MNKKRILHVTGAMNVGGTETMLVNLYRKINNNIQFDFISYSNEEAYYDKEIKDLGGNVIRLKPPSEVGFIEAVKDIKKVIKENGHYDAVHTHMLFNCGIAMIAAYLSSVKVRVSHAHTTSDNSESFIRKVYISVMRIFIKLFSTDFLACSDGAGRYLFGRNITSNKKYNLLPNFIDYEKFIKCEDKSSIRKEFGIKDEDIVVCHIGRFINAKNHSFLLEVANEMIKRNDKIKLLLVGTGDLKNEIEDKVKELGIGKNVYLTGIRNDIPNILNNSDLFILPSIYEGLGLVLLEAQASNVPCLVSEAVQPEVDLNIGLVKQLKLSYGSKKWALEAEVLINKNKSQDINVMESVKKKGYDLNSIMNNLVSVYKLNLE